MAMADLNPRLAVEDQKIRSRPQGEERTRPVIVVQINGNTLCSVADLRSDGDADLVRGILAQLYAQLDTTKGNGPASAVPAQGLGAMIPREGEQR